MRRITDLLSLVSLLALAGLVSCANPVRDGQRLFAGCPDGVDDQATLRSGLFVCKGARDPAPFGGNGRACGDCHVPGDNFGMSIARIQTLPDDHPFFFDGLDEDPVLLRERGLVHVIAPPDIDELRRTPKLVQLRALCDDEGRCDSLGLLGDRVRELCAFSAQAIVNHMAKTPERVSGRDFRAPTRAECDALIAYMLSDLVAGQDER